MKNTARNRIKNRTGIGTGLIFSSMLFEFIILLERFLFSFFLNDTGMGYYSFVYEMYTIIMVVFSWSLTYGVSKTVRNRIAKGQIKNTGRVRKAILIYGAIIGIFICLLSIVTSEFVSGTILMQPLNKLALWVMAPLLMISVFVSAFLGYFEGIGTIVPTSIARLTGAILSCVFGFLFGKLFLNYGQKVAKVVQNENHAPAYAVIGIFVGLLLSQIIVLVFLILVNHVHGRTVKRQLKEDNSKILDSYPDLLKNIYIYGLPFTLIMLCLRGVVFVNMMLYAHCGSATDFSVQYGSFYGKYAVLIGFFVCLLGFMIAKPLNAIVHYHKREEYRAVKDIFSGAIHSFMIYGIPITVLTAVLAQPITNCFFSNDETIVFLIQVSSTLIFLIPCALFFVYVMQRIGKEMVVLKNVAIAFVLQTIAVIFFLYILKLGIVAIAYGYMIMFLVIVVSNGITLMRYLKCTLDYFHIILVPVIAAGIAGLLAMLLSRALLDKAGSLITTLVCGILGYIGYFVLFFALKGATEKELNKISGGKLLRQFATMFRLL